MAQSTTEEKATSLKAEASAPRAADDKSGGGATASSLSADALHDRDMTLDLDWIGQVRGNRTAVERRAATLTTRRSVKKEWQAAWLLRAIELMDLTTLAGDDTPGRVRRLAAKAR